MSLEGILTTIFGLLVVAWGWIFHHTNGRIKSLEEKKANETSVGARFDDVLDALSDHVDEDRSVHERIAISIEKISDKLDTTNNQLAETKIMVGTIAGRLEK